MPTTTASPSNPKEGLGLLFVVLFVVAIFGTAYYLFVTRYIAPDPAPTAVARTSEAGSPLGVNGTAANPPPPADKGVAEEVPSPWAIRGQFGDLFGGLNAMFTGITLAGLIYTLHLQRNSMTLQRDAMAQQERSLKLQQESLDASMKAIQEQSRIAAEAAHLQALVALKEEWNRLSQHDGISKVLKEDILRQSQGLSSDLIEAYENYRNASNKLRDQAPPSSTPVGKPA